ncbi:type VI secretion system baseplate subunit TssE [Sphingomonas gilva]|uniref:Type VI secretion system baseplate subunit TssE n=1 Tax=Sphingomonas gilva TaxID=2305907 RepID=A0A396RMU4_9SPHN|nr:type VI secretion system baseplate subunit TssE [Sphingomonas gilva]RHW17016.1 type VI secretion system baseplate subunit TssE [Sphingomonas gilva]
MAVKQRLTPTLFDKLVADTKMSGLKKTDAKIAEAETSDISSDVFKYYSVPQLERFNEAALRMTVRRELAWLLNTVNYDAGGALDAYPQVQTSVVNYGVPDLAGQIHDRRAVLQRAREIRKAIRTFEPRIEPQSLAVEAVEARDKANTVTYLIKGDISAAAGAMPVKFRTDVDADDASVEVSE